MKEMHQVLDLLAQLQCDVERIERGISSVYASLENARASIGTTEQAVLRNTRTPSVGERRLTDDALNDWLDNDN